MKILFISTSIPPCEDMQTTRNVFLIKSLINAGNQVDIVTCGTYQKGQSSFDKIINMCTIYRTPFPLIYKWHLFAQKIFKNTPLLKIHNVLINYYAKPDLYVGWDVIALKKIKEKNLSNYDVVITSSGSYTAHIVGNKWKRQYKKAWIAEYGDPWGLDAYGNINQVYFQKEHLILSKCDGLVFTTQATINAYKDNYALNIPYCLVQCGYENIIDDINIISESHYKKIIFSYTGVAYKKSRNLEPFLKAIGTNEKSSAKIVGSYSEKLKNNIKKYNNIDFTGRVNYKKSLEILASSDVLVHIGNLGTMQVPGKTYIYLSTQKPILYIQQEEKNDPTYEILAEFEGIVFCKNKKEEIQKAINYIINNYQILKQKAEERTFEEKIKKYCWDELGKKFANFVKSCVNNTKC